jgi:hypothetical protein
MDSVLDRLKGMPLVPAGTRLFLPTIVLVLRSSETEPERILAVQTGSMPILLWDSPDTSASTSHD